MTDETRRSGTVKTDETLLTIVEALRGYGPTGVTKLATLTGFSKSTIYKHLNTLEQDRYVVSHDGTYQLGFKFLSLGGYVRDDDELCHLANSKVGELGEETGQMILVSVKEHDRGVFTYVDRSRYDIKNIILGEQFHLHTSASGKAMLAECSDDHVEQIVDDNGLSEMTEHTITDKETLYEEIESIRDRGFALNKEERQEGIRAVSAAITAPESGTICAMTIAGPANRLPVDELENEYANAVLGVINEIELELKY